MNLRDLRQANESRAKRWNGGAPASLSFAMMELAGEVGEACNDAKKIERMAMGWPGGEDRTEALRDELADVIICVDLVAMKLGIDLSEAVAQKFNKTSEKHGFPERLGKGAAAADRIEALAAELREVAAALNLDPESAVGDGHKAVLQRIREWDADREKAWAENAELRQHASEYEADLNAARAVVERLTKTADGVPVVPGDTVWVPMYGVTSRAGKAVHCCEKTFMLYRDGWEFDEDAVPYHGAVYSSEYRASIAATREAAEATERSE